MKQQRINSEAIINVHTKETKTLSIATLIDDFTCLTSVQKNTFHLIKLRPDVLVIHCFIRIFSPSICFLNL